MTIYELCKTDNSQMSQNGGVKVVNKRFVGRVMKSKVKQVHCQLTVSQLLPGSGILVAKLFLLHVASFS